MARDTQRIRWQNRYLNDPIAFVHDHLRWQEGRKPTDYQEAILAAMVEHKRVAVRGPHGLGKSALAAWAVLWRVLTWEGEDYKVPTLASVWRQLSAYLWPEIHKWARAVKWEGTGRGAFTQDELMLVQLRGRTGQAFALASNDHTAIEGAHSDHIAYVFDESKSIPDSTWDAAEGALTTGDAHWLAISTPGPPSGRFYEIHSRKAGYEEWFCRMVTIDEMIRAGRIDPAVVEARERQWGGASAVFKSRMLGEFAEQSENGIVPLSWIDEAQERWRGLAGVERKAALVSVGVDVGGGGAGGDKSVMALLYADSYVELRKFAQMADPHMATMELCGRVKSVWEALRPRFVVIDAVGVGLGVLHRLREEGVPALAFGAGERCDLRDRSGELGFANWRASGWWTLREALEPGAGIGLALPEDDELTGELTAPSYRVNSTGRIQIEEKEALRGRLHRSTDSADALIHALCGPLLAQEEQGGSRYAVVEDLVPRKARY